MCTNRLITSETGRTAWKCNIQLPSSVCCEFFGNFKTILAPEFINQSCLKIQIRLNFLHYRAYVKNSVKPYHKVVIIVMLLVHHLLFFFFFLLIYHFSITCRYLDNKVFVSLANGEVIVYQREAGKLKLFLASCKFTGMTNCQLLRLEEKPATSIRIHRDWLNLCLLLQWYGFNWLLKFSV